MSSRSSVSVRVLGLAVVLAFGYHSTVARADAVFRIGNVGEPNSLEPGQITAQY